MSDLFPNYSGGTNYRVPNVDVIATAFAAITAGDVVPISASAPLVAGVFVATSTATAAQRKAAYVGVAMASAASGATLPVRIQGSCYALVKRTSGCPIAVGDPLCFGTAKALEADPPAVNTNRWGAYAASAVAVGTSATASLQKVVLTGIYGHGIQPTGT